MDLFTDPDMPHWLKVMIWTAIAGAAATAIIKQLRDSKVLAFVARELQSNGGKSTKDLITRAADDSTKAVRLAEVQDKRGRRTARRVKNLVLEMKGIEYRFARWVLHQKNGHAPSDAMVKEAEIVIATTPEIVKEASKTHPLHWGPNHHEKT